MDGVRGLAIALVMIYHQTLLKNADGLSFIDASFVSIAHVGWCGVDLFFVLSGFLITGILLDTKQQPRYYRNFYARRILRIFPLYYAVVFVSLVVLPNLPAGVVPPSKLHSFGRIGDDAIWYWLYLSNYAIAAAGAWRHGILDISWSLAIEEQFYLVWPTLVLLLDRQRLMQVCVALFLSALVLRIVFAASGVNPIATYVLTPARLDPLAAGAWIAAAARGPGGMYSLAVPARRFATVSLVALAVLFAWRGGLDARDAPVATLGYSLLALLGGGTLVLTLIADPRSALRRFFENRPLRSLGKYSYALYLFHLPLRATVRDTIYGRSSFGHLLGSQIPGQILFYALSTALAYGAAWISWHAYERYFLRLKRYF